MAISPEVLEPVPVVLTREDWNYIMLGLNDLNTRYEQERAILDEHGASPGTADNMIMENKRIHDSIAEQAFRKA